MRLMFVYWQLENAGSAQDILHYSEAARTLGHEVALYAPPEGPALIHCSLDIESADAVVFVLEWNLYLHPGGDKKDRLVRTGLMGIGHLNVVKLFSRVPRERRVIIDYDGMYNDAIHVGGDFNHPDAAGQPPPHRAVRQPLRQDLPADAPSAAAERAARSCSTPTTRRGNGRWTSAARSSGCSTSAATGSAGGRCSACCRRSSRSATASAASALVGHDWAAMPWWVESPLREQAYFTDPAYLKALGVEIMPPVPVEQVIPTMSQGDLQPGAHPAAVRPPGAGDLPHVRDARGQHHPAVRAGRGLRARDLRRAGRRLVLGGRTPRNRSSTCCAGRSTTPRSSEDIRRHLAEKHSYAARLQRADRDRRRADGRSGPTMRLMFVHHVIEDRGSAQDMYNYAHVARALGHEVALYGPPRRGSAFHYSLEIDSADAVDLHLRVDDRAAVRRPLSTCARLVGKVPRRRRVVIDCDGNYNDAISVDRRRQPSRTPRRAAAGSRCATACRTRFFQPTLHPLRPNVRPFFFHAYNPAWERPLDFAGQGVRHGLRRQQLVPLAGHAAGAARRSSRSATRSAASASSATAGTARRPGPTRRSARTPTTTTRSTCGGWAWRCCRRSASTR